MFASYRMFRNFREAICKAINITPEKTYVDSFCPCSEYIAYLQIQYRYSPLLRLLLFDIPLGKATSSKLPNDGVQKVCYQCSVLWAGEI